MNTKDIKEAFITMLANEEFTLDKSGCKMIEILGASFTADVGSIFGKPNREYIERELEWYLSQSLNVQDIPGVVPKIWLNVSDENYNINSNYGYLIYSKENGSQYERVLSELSMNHDSRRGTMIYTRPSMHDDCVKNGMNDFICTNAVSYFIRDGKLHATVQMRSNDVIFGYPNDYAWQYEVLTSLAYDLSVDRGNITWQAASLHVYERHFNKIK